jgi:folylpolyglutamate synthase/dihydropteroate synthase
MPGSLPAAVIAEHATVGAALDFVAAKATAADRILAFGSFFVAAAALEWADRNGYRDAKQ